jgi:hypothetical protein
MGSRYRLTTSWAILSATVGIPNGRVSVLLSPFGISTLRTGGGKWLPEASRFQSLERLFERPASKSATDCPSTPAAPWLAFTFLKASQISRFGMSNGFALSTELLLLPVGSEPRLNNAVPSVQSHYSTFIPTTDCSAPVPRIGTLVLAGFAAWTSPFASGRQVLTFLTRA